VGTFTLTLKRVIDITGGTVIIDPSTGIASLSGGNIGLDYYPIFDPAYKPQLTGKIVDHYWNREIGMETIDMFQLAMRRKMNEIMPYYNQLYESTKVEYDPLSTVDLTTINTVDTTNHSETNSTQGGTTASRSVSSETPQTMLSGNEDYATGAADTNATHNATGDNIEDTTGDVEGNTQTTGYQGVASDLIMRYRESLVNIDVMILNELQELFMLVWDNGDEYSDNYPLFSGYFFNYNLF
jgi:hypothetical protein